MTDEELIALADRLEAVAPKRIPGTSNDFAFRMDGLSLIDRITINPAPEGRGVTIEVTGRLTEMLALATGEPTQNRAMYANDGAGKGNCALPQFLRAVV
ncbi:hypothetical protein [Novosphingobium sp.]|uniref:hypothetical protein n=1 Tax=Novosphingobium sp. TaxID=1874826 RepID=UPI00286DFE45|nr:hypothetical protein [Novosphingobium sp.]